ncbi:MAG: histidinol-phosphatase [Clostridia bacterium]|nr:histidinol-phosphatase [Clostridia bacterium]
MKYSYHNHTPLCQHAFGTPEEYVREAISAGLLFFGFSCHAPHHFSDGYVSPIRMREEQLPEYADTVLSLRHKYRDYINIGLGLEYELYRPTFNEDIAYYRSAGIEYLLLGQHFTDDETLPTSFNSYHETDSAEGLSAYTDTVIEAMSTGLISYVAHPDCFFFSGDERLYLAEADRLILASKKYGVPLEVNAFGHSRGRHYPRVGFWERAAALGADCVIGIDAHTPERVYIEKEIASTRAFLDTLGITPLDRIPLRKI